ncbi:MAG: glycine cleavage system aminomethyltransferase GcvT [Deltaproteobacteria bacterium]|nr:glycine cleavage system aminomethyltransferase GcvT [Deltaproteobacteria bacterium]
MGDLNKTVLHDRHVALGATMVDFGGWHMPLQYKTGIVEEHLATRKSAGLFDVSHMGRFVVRGAGALAFLQHVLSNNAAALDAGFAQYTMIPDDRGGAIDDAYLYRFLPDEYLLVVNAANRAADWRHLSALLPRFPGAEMEDVSGSVAMISLQGPASRAILEALIGADGLPEPLKNALTSASFQGKTLRISRTGYTGEPLGFEFFLDAADAPRFWDLCLERGAVPVGLGARDTLRLEAGLPLYGHELGKDPAGSEIPIFACPLARFAVSLSPLKGEFIGREVLTRQWDAWKGIQKEDYRLLTDLPRRIVPFALRGKGIARAGFRVFKGAEEVGFVTSGTMVPCWKTDGTGLSTRFTGEREMRAIGLMLVDSRLKKDDLVGIEIRGNRVDAVVVPWHLRSDTPPYAMPILPRPAEGGKEPPTDAWPGKALDLLTRAVRNTRWRQTECVNLIPSEQTVSPMVRRLTMMDPAHRYAEHRAVRSYYDADIFYYQGTAFIEEVENLLRTEMTRYLGCRKVEPRVISGQMANAVVFSALVDYLNRGDTKAEQRRIGPVLNNHLIRGGHLSAQPMGALHNFVRIDPRTEKPAVVNFPVLPENPYKIDVEAALRVIDEHRPELIIFGKSMVLHREPVREIREFLQEQKIGSIILYDMAHVLGLVGPHFQEPFAEGADLVTGSTHKTFFGTQRGVVAGNWREEEKEYALWEFVENRTFPGSVSNHHLGTLLGLLMAAYEMNAFRDPYQQAVIGNAKAFAAALRETGLRVAGDPAIAFTETHQVVVKVEYAKGVEAARRLEESNIICNYQAAPDEEGFTAAGALRLGVQEMTRFGMEPDDFRTLAQYIHDVVTDGRSVRDEVAAFRKRFLTMCYCFTEERFGDVMDKLHRLI